MTETVRPTNEKALNTRNLSVLAARAAGGDAAATDALLCAAWPSAYRIAWTMLRERTAAEDAAQDACARVLVSIATLRRPQSFAAWFYRIVVNEAKCRLRSARRELPFSSDVPNDEVDAAAARIDVRRAIDELDPVLRVIVVMHYYYALNSFEIAEVLGTSPVTVRWRLLLARRCLRPLLEDPVEPIAHSPTTQGVRDERQPAG